MNLDQLCQSPALRFGWHHASSLKVDALVIKLNLDAECGGFERELQDRIAYGQISAPLFKNGISSV